MPSHSECPVYGGAKAVDATRGRLDACVLYRSPLLVQNGLTTRHNVHTHPNYHCRRSHPFTDDWANHPLIPQSRTAARAPSARLIFARRVKSTDRARCDASCRVGGTGSRIDRWRTQDRGHQAYAQCNKSWSQGLQGSGGRPRAAPTRELIVRAAAVSRPFATGMASDRVASMLCHSRRRHEPRGETVAAAGQRHRRLPIHRILGLVIVIHVRGRQWF